jgi:hypothetical protein
VIRVKSESRSRTEVILEAADVNARAPESSGSDLLAVHFIADTVVMDEDTHDTRLFAAFERHDEFVAAQNILLAVDLFAEPSREEQDAEYECSLKLALIVSRLSYLWLIFLDWIKKVWRISRTVVSVGPVS